MPRRKSYVKKRFIRRRRYGRKNKIILNKMSVGAPQSVVRRLRYQDYGVLNVGAAGVVDRDYYRLTSPYAPMGSGGQRNASARFYDEYMQMYKYFTVLGAKVTVQYTNTDTSEQQRAGVTVTDSTGAQTVGDDYVENERLTKNALLGVEGGQSMRTFTINWSAKKWFSHPTILAERDMEGTITSNPSTNAYFHLWADNPWGYQPTNGVAYVVTIDYIVKFRTPKLIAQS